MNTLVFNSIFINQNSFKMTSKKSFSEIETLERYRIALENVVKQTELFTAMSNFGYDAETIALGQQKYDQCRHIYDLNKTEDQESKDAYAAFESKFNQLVEDYKLHRKKAKIVFRKEAGIIIKLKLDGQVPTSYLKFMEVMKVFYKILLEDVSLQTEVGSLNISLEQLTAAKALLDEVDAARVDYLREVGESQDATKQKDASFAEIDDWMHEFYAVSHIALEDNPQLLEALGVFVRS